MFRRPFVGWRSHVYRGLLSVGVPFFVVACVFSYYGQLNRTPSADTYGTTFTAVAIVQKHTIWLDDYVPYIQAHAGKYPYMLKEIQFRGATHAVTATPTASSAMALPVVALFNLFGAKASAWGAWMEAGMLTAALAAAASVGILFALLRRLTTQRRAALIGATYAWATFQWGVSGQALWQHGGACLALTTALYALTDRRLVLAGAATAAMVAFRPTTPVIALCLLPLIGRRLFDWLRFAIGVLPFALPLALYNWVAFGSPLHQGYGTGHATGFLDLQSGRDLYGIPGLLVAPGRGLLVYSPVLAFAVLGAIRGWRQPIYRWSAIAVVAYVVVIGNDNLWYGGESFGARKLTEVVPLLIVLLVPAVDAIVRTRWIWAYVGLLAWSVFVELVGASEQPADIWFNGPKPHDLSSYSTWWSLTDNELVAILRTPGSAVRLAEMAALLLGSVLLGLIADRSLVRSRRPARL